MLTDEQRRMRMLGLGASDMNALSGLSKRWRPIDVYKSKVNPLAEECLSEDKPFPNESPETIDTLRGDFLEPACRAWYAHMHDAYVRDPGTRKHRTHKLILASADGLVEFADARPKRGLEIKCPRFNKVDDWCPGDFPRDVRVPSYYLPQVTCEAAVLEVESTDMAVLLGDELRVINVPFDPDFFDSLVYLAEKFWRDCVVPRRPPKPDASQSYHDYLRGRYPKSVDVTMLEADAVMLREARAYFEAGQKIKQLDAVQAAARNYLESCIGEARGISFGNRVKITWTNDSDQEVVDYRGLLQHLDVPRELLEKYTSIKPGPRKFRPSMNGWKK